MQSDQFALHAEIEQRHWWFVARRRIIRCLVEAVAPPGTGKVLVDVGCGTGANVAALADAYDCCGIDTSAEGIRLARERFPKVQFSCGFAPQDFGPVEQAADVILLNDVIEHVPDDFELVTSLLAAMKPGSHLLITVPADESLWSTHDESFGHYRRYCRSRLERVWQGLPVTPVLVSHYMSRLYPIVKAVRTIQQWRGRAAGQAGTDFSMPADPINRLLTGIFAGESNRLLAVLKAGKAAYTRGVSLVALLRREEGELRPCSRPADVPADRHTPRLQAAAEIQPCVGG